MRFVADASVGLSWLLSDEQDAYAEAVLALLGQATVVVPSHWILEVANGLLMAERRKRSTVADTTRGLTTLGSFPLSTDSRTSVEATRATLALARERGLTIYDAAYIELCLREDLPLATLDERLAKACEAAGGRQLKL